MGINYRGHSLAVETRPSPGNVQAGDRAPDAPCHDSEGSPRRLFDVFRGTHFTLLGFGGEAQPLIEAIAQPWGATLRPCTVIREGEGTVAGGLVDTQGHAVRAYEMKNGDLALVRPDGYIGVATDGENHHAIGDYLQRVAAPSV